MKSSRAKLSTIVFLSVFGLGTMLTGCEKDEQITEMQESAKTSTKALSGIPNCEAIITNGYLSFKSEDDLNTYFKYLEMHTDREVDALEAKNGFMSYSRKVEMILRQYEILNENRSTKMEEILSFRKKNEDYLTITDEDFFLKIEGLFNRVVNQDGYVQIANNFFKYEGTTVYSTLKENAELLKRSDYSSGLVSKIETEVRTVKTNTRQVNQWQQGQFTTKIKCGRWHRTHSYLKFYASGPSTPAYGQTGLMYCSAGFKYYLKNMKRGWTGIWYGQSRESRFQGYYHSSYNGFTNFNDYNHSVTVSRTYNARTWANVWKNDPVGAQLWANKVFYGMWAYVAGTVTYDVCGTKTYTY